MYTSPHDYAQQIISAANNSIPGVAEALNNADVSVINQAASLLQATSANLDELERASSERVQNAVQEYRTTRRESETAQLDQTE